MSTQLEEPIADIVEAYSVSTGITRDLNVAEDSEDAIDARTGCLASAKQALERLETYVQDLLTGDHGPAKHATRAELVLPELLHRLQRRYRKISSKSVPSPVRHGAPCCQCGEPTDGTSEFCGHECANRYYHG